MRSPLEIHAEKSLLQKLSIGALAVLGGGAFAYLAGPGMLVFVTVYFKLFENNEYFNRQYFLWFEIFFFVKCQIVVEDCIT